MNSICFRKSRSSRPDSGFTIVEVLIAVSILAFVLTLGGLLISKTSTFMSASRVRQNANIEARRCMETIERMVTNGKASTLVIATPDTTPTAPPNSQIQFTAMDGAAYVITWSTLPMNSVHILRTPPGGGPATDTVLATSINVLTFLADMNDPGLVQVTLQSTTQMEGTQTYTISLPVRFIRMNED